MGFSAFIYTMVSCRLEFDGKAKFICRIQVRGIQYGRFMKWRGLKSGGVVRAGSFLRWLDFTLAVAGHPEHLLSCHDIVSRLPATVRATRFADRKNQLSAVAKNNFLHPIVAVFRGLENDKSNALKTLIYQCVYGDL